MAVRGQGTAARPITGSVDFTDTQTSFVEKAEQKCDKLAIKTLKNTSIYISFPKKPSLSWNLPSWKGRYLSKGRMVLIESLLVVSHSSNAAGKHYVKFLLGRH
ncbi:hypothetical protein AQUCO_03200060v1 [Aquilegia coerulea]|uniref:Uncharacterized protein n=1 Tax=Aquilegia coerulea TaxID=218851 RepID=A0A2G5CZX7_AQUCA|nr:hypothetical protein AQUCO_03200060v1 [Aquilegia coerulea]